MPGFLLRIEGVNFDWSVYDTQDLSTVRGGSLLNIRAPRDLVEVYRQQPSAHAIPDLAELSWGASQAIYCFQADNDDVAERVRRCVERLLNEDKRFRHATFVVDVVEEAAATDKEVETLGRVRAMNHWRQLQQPTLAVPAELSAAEIEEAGREFRERSIPRLKEMPARGRACEVDLVRPALRIRTRGPDEAEWVSDSVFERGVYGRQARQRLYQEEAGEAAAGNLQFTSDLEQLSVRRLPDESNGGDPKDHLDRKMAVICLDGNKQSEWSYGLDKQGWKDFREYVRSRHRDVLRNLLEMIRCEIAAGEGDCAAGNDWQWKGADERVRLETLLWGGDDIEWVAPAWQGWRVVQLFFEHLTGKRGEAWKVGKDALTYSAGMVFCHHNAPIQRMRKLAWKLVDAGKARCGREGSGNWLGYEVLESFDVVGDQFLAVRDRRLGSSMHGAAARLLIRGADLAEVSRNVREIRAAAESGSEEISRRRIERLVRELGRVSIDSEAVDKELVEITEICAPFDTLCHLVGDCRAALLHTAMLWDYLFEPETKTPAVGLDPCTTFASNSP